MYNFKNEFDLISNKKTNRIGKVFKLAILIFRYPI